MVGHGNLLDQHPLDGIFRVPGILQKSIEINAKRFGGDIGYGCGRSSAWNYAAILRRRADFSVSVRGCSKIVGFAVR